MQIKPEYKVFLYLSLSFVIFTIVGTLTHEGGHFLMATCLHVPATLHYNFTSLEAEMINAQSRLYITLAGPLVSMGLGTYGFYLCLKMQKKQETTEALTATQWLSILLSLFWLRPLFNFIRHGVLYFFSNGATLRSDEEQLADYLALPSHSISATMAFISLLLLLWVFFKRIPHTQRFTFLLAALFGSLLGYWLWMMAMGPLILP